MKKILLVVVLILSVICGGCAAEQIPETEPAAAATELPQETVFAAPTEAPSEVPETVPPTEAPTESTEPTEPEPVAELIAEGVQVFIDAGDYTHSLSDDNIWSKQRITKEQQLSIVSETPFSGLYLQWDLEPGEYAIVWDGGRAEWGQQGFLYDYIRLPEAITHCVIEFRSEAEQWLCDVEVFTEGTAPEGVQAWLPPCEQADILVFPTHSDDDVLFFGPLISYYAVERGLQVQTAFMVDHTSEPERKHERLNGLWELGVRNYPILGNAPDTGMTDLHQCMSYYANHGIDRWQVEQIRRFKPLVIVGHDLNGEYGNGGHKVNSYLLTQTVEAAADSGQFPESADRYGVWDTPKLYLHLYEENEILLEVDTVMANDPAGRTPFEAAEAAFRCHYSQHQYGFRVQHGGARKFDCRPFGLYRSLVGPDTKADIMDNLDVQAWRS